MDNRPVMLLGSGGLDTLCTVQALRHMYQTDDNEDITVYPVMIDYGQKTFPFEFCAFSKILYRAGLGRFPIERLKAEVFDKDGHMSDPRWFTLENSECEDSIEVPGRNFVFLSIATSIAAANRCREIWAGFHYSEEVGFTDESLGLTRKIVDIVSCGTVKLISPLNVWDAASLFLAEPEMVEVTYSCMNGFSVHCGRCPKCFERKKRLSYHGDPTQYMTDAEFNHILGKKDV